MSVTIRFKNIRINPKQIPQLSKTNALFYEMIKKSIKRTRKEMKKFKSKFEKEDKKKMMESLLLGRRLVQLTNKLKKIAAMHKKKTLKPEDSTIIYNNEICHVASFSFDKQSSLNLTCLACLEEFSPYQITSIQSTCCKQYNYCGNIVY